MFLIIIYKHPAIYKLAIDIKTGQVLAFTRRNHAKKYAVMNMLGVYDIHEFKGAI
jgi:hypothetical protein